LRSKPINKWLKGNKGLVKKDHANCDVEYVLSYLSLIFSSPSIPVFVSHLFLLISSSISFQLLFLVILFSKGNTTSEFPSVLIGYFTFVTFLSDDTELWIFNTCLLVDSSWPKI